MTLSLFSALVEDTPKIMTLSDGAFHLKGCALKEADRLLADINTVTNVSPFRQMETARGFKMSVGMTNTGDYGWVSDRKGYRYSALDPLTGSRWPAMPQSFLRLAEHAASQAGFHNFRPDVCLINAYGHGAKMGLHQDRDEQDFTAPIVSVSLGLSAVFLLGGCHRADQTQKILLDHGDVFVFGGESRLRFHGVLPIKAGFFAPTNHQRFNLTFRKAH